MTAKFGFLEQLGTILGARRFRFTCEKDLQDGIAAVLTEAGLDFQRELELSRQDRPDFLLHRVAIEVKVDGSLSALTRQIARYAEHELVDGILVVTSLARLTNLPDEIRGKRVHVVHLIGSVL